VPHAPSPLLIKRRGGSALDAKSKKKRGLQKAPKDIHLGPRCGEGSRRHVVVANPGKMRKNLVRYVGD